MRLAALYTVASAVGAALLFAVEPMVAKMLLPAYGGSPMVWNTAVLFFQGALLLGYGYAHLTQRLGRRQPLLHIVVVCLPLVLLPVSIPAWSGAPEGSPTSLWLLMVLAAAVGGPFAVLATTGPLLQRWYSWSGLPRAHDPYFLYAAGNAGSLAALLAYPFVIEPLSALPVQSRWWAWGYVLFAVLMVVTALSLRKGAIAVAEEEPEAEPVSWLRRLRWLGLAFLPSSLMLGVTTHVSTDIAPVPLMWVVPLALYLLTFIIAFARRDADWTPWVKAAAVCGVVMPWVLLMGGKLEALTAISLDVLLLVVAGLACHGLLAKDRPEAGRLTEFFLTVSLGGVLGGLFNGLLAPLLFTWTAELTIASAALVVLAFATRPGSLGLYARLALCGPVPLLLLLLTFGTDAGWGPALGVPLTVVWALILARDPKALLVTSATGTIVIMASTTFHGDVQDRTFFGQYSIEESDGRRVFSHGTTIHGFQLLDQPGTPTAYYSRRGPVGAYLEAFGGTDRIAMVGLGTGALAAYAKAGQHLDVYEIDPQVVRYARDRFSFLDDCLCQVNTIVGDGRLSLEKAPDASYGLIVLDAFSSDAVPAHLLTREAITLYQRKLKPGGVLAFNLSNRNLDLVPVLAATARAAGLATLYSEDRAPATRTELPSVWAVAARTKTDLAPLKGWQEPPSGGPVWTDTYSSLFGVLRLRFG